MGQPARHRHRPAALDMSHEGYQGFISDFAFQPAMPDEGGETRLAYASLICAPVPEAYWQNVAVFYGKLISDAIMQPGQSQLTWGDVLDVYAVDWQSLAAEIGVQGLEFTPLPGELSLALEAATLTLPGRLIADPLGYEQAMRLNWSGLATQASNQQIQTYFDSTAP